LGRQLQKSCHFYNFTFMDIAPPRPLDVEIDKLTNSIENAITSEVSDTVVVLMTLAHEKQIKKRDWQFDWKKELKDTSKQTYKLLLDIEL